MGRDKTKIVKGGHVDTLIGKGVRVRGDLQFEGVLFLDGQVNGNVVSEVPESLITVGAQGVVEGEIRAPNVVIHGTVKGNVYASAHVSLAADARVEGSIHYHLIEMQLGATITGQLLPLTAAPAKLEVRPAKAG